MGRQSGAKRQVEFVDNEQTDAFERLRTSSPQDIFDNKNLFDNNPIAWQELTNGAGASITHLPDEAAMRLRVGTVSGEYSIRQTRRYFTYIPGKSQLVTMTGIIGTGKENVTKRIGYFDYANGLFFEQEGTTLRVVRRTNTSGSIVDNQIDQVDWNIDKLDGKGPSGITLDVTKTQIFIIDFQWLGVGRIRFGVDVGGKTQYVHEIINSNQRSKVYMATPTLPLRYEIVNTGISASNTDLIEICSSVVSEGGEVKPAHQFSAGLGASARTVSTRSPVMAIRLKDTLGGKANRRTGSFLSSGGYVVNNAAFIEVAHLNDPTNITSATWTLAASGSAIEYSTDISSVTGNVEHVFTSFYITATGKGNSQQGASEKNTGILNNESIITQTVSSDNSQMLVVYGTTMTGSSDVSINIDWIETD